MLNITNTLTRKKEPFVPLESGKVTMYVCGPTVYNLIHVGNARPLVVFDMVRRYLEYSGFNVKHVMNYTDVDDKIINKAREQKITWNEVTKQYVAEYQRDMESLKVLSPHSMPKVSDHILSIVSLIKNLVANGSAYVSEDGEVLFSVRKFKAYGKLSGKNIDELLSGARVEVSDKKKDPLDFSLWKPQKSSDEPAWDSPWGKGRPGWHIECSAMAMEYLGDTFDIHGGGIDLMHPHHENEIAQSEASTQKPYVRFWLHNNLLTINSEKMSKSQGNIFLAREFIERYSAETLKFLLISGHYRSPLDFSERHIRESQAGLHRVYSALKRAKAMKDIPSSPAVQTTTEEKSIQEFGTDFQSNWKEAMDDDFNTAKVIGLIFDYVRALNAYVDRKGFKPSAATGKIVDKFLADMKEISEVLNIFGEEPSQFLASLKNLVLKEKKISSTDIDKKINERVEARGRKDFQTADSIRKELLAQGIELRDTASSTEWDVVFQSTDDD